MLLYVVEGAVPILTYFLYDAISKALRKEHPAHRKSAIRHAIATIVSSILVVALVRIGFTIGGKAPQWIMTVHMVFIYSIFPLLAALYFTSRPKRRKFHLVAATLYGLNWLAALGTGLMIFLMARGYV